MSTVSPRTLLILAAAGLAGWWLFGPRDSWRYRMTIEVQTPDGVRTGSAVRAVTYHRRAGFLLVEGKPTWKVKGQAVAVDLPKGRTLYAVMRANWGDVDYGARIAHRTFSETGHVSGYPGPVELYPTHPDTGFKQTNPVPNLITFADQKDPTTAESVDPAHLDATFGPGYSLKRITIEVVARPITDDIRQRLPWLTEIRERQLDPSGSALNPGVAKRLTHGDFLNRG